MSNEKPLHQKSAQGKISRGQKHSVEHLSCTVPLQIQKVQRFSYLFSFVRLSHAATVRPGALHATSCPWPAPRTHAWPIPGVGSNEPRRRWRLLRWLHLPVAANKGPSPLATPPGAAQHPLALRVSLPCQRTPVAPSPWPGKHGTCSLPPTGPRRPVLSNSPIAPNPSSIST